MARIAVPFTGITSHSNYNDGECRALVNLRPENGAYKPVPPRKIIQELEFEFDIIFEHQLTNEVRLIGVSGNNVYDVTHSTMHLFSAPMVFRYDGVPSGIDQTIKSIQQIGNTLSLVTSYSTYYLLYKDSAYTVLGEIPELPEVHYSTPEMTTATRKYHAEYPSGVTSGVLLDATKSLVDILIESNKNKFHDAFLIRHAFRLYDGSVIKHSPPILVMPRENYQYWGTAKLPNSIPADPNGMATDEASEVSIKQYVLQLSYDFTHLELWKDIIRSIDFFVSAYTGIVGPESVVNGFWSRHNIDGVSDLYRGFRRSDGFYVTSGTIGSTGYTGGRAGRSTSSKRSSDVSGSTQSRGIVVPEVQETDYTLPPAIATEIDRVIGASSMFFHYYSVDDFGASDIIMPNGRVTSDIRSVIYQELMPADDMSHHRYGAQKASVYNGRLRLTNIVTHPFDGFGLGMYGWGSPYNGESNEGVVEGIGPLYVHVSINTPEGVKKVQRTLYSATMFLTPFISYPDPRAFRMEVYHFRPNDTPPPSYVYDLILSIELKPHPYLNIAYWMPEELKPVLKGSSDQTDSEKVLYERRSWRDSNMIKVSGPMNPFVFPVENTYQVGYGKILSEASILMNVSDRNYGIYPVFVFTDNGIFTMAGSTSELVHESVESPTYLEPPVSDVICPTPYGVVFITKRGLMIINQHKTDYLSPQFRTPGPLVRYKDDIQQVSPLFTYPLHEFTQFLAGVNTIFYNPYHDELIISNSMIPYDYVYDFVSKSYYISTEKVSSLVQNSYPDVYAVDGKKIKDYSQKQSPSAEVAIVTHPLFFRTPDLKKLERVIFRGIMHNLNGVDESTNSVVMICQSNDGVVFERTRGMYITKNGCYKDIDMGLFARVKRRCYQFLLSGVMDEESDIQCIEFETDKEYNNEKMR